MAVTITGSPANQARSDEFWGRRRVHLLDVTMDNSYPTGGLACDFGPFGVGDSGNAKYLVQPRPVLGSPNKAFIAQYDRANKKMLVFQQKDPGAAGGADIPFTEVANLTDLSALVIDVIAIER